MQSYISRYGSPHPLIKSARPCKAGIIVAIPSKNESGLLDVLKSVVNCIEPDCAVEIIALLNSASDSDGSVKEFHSQQYVACRRWAAESTPEWLNIHILRQDDLPPSTAGVGLARKIIMDEAVRRFSDASDSEQIILSLDADTLVSPDYLVEVWNSFKKKEDYDAANIYFEHPISGTEFESNIYQAIIDYELHLRYYRQGLKYTGHPFHHHCVGSALAVRNRSYQKFGGMNTRKAGEDFYFFQKIVMNGKVFDITSTCVYPSPRISDRVVFGTGRAVSDILSSESQQKFTYHPSML